jgi:hypothetical protein
MYIIDLSFVLYKYNVYFQQQKKILSGSKQEKIEKIIKNIEEILTVSVNEICDNININTLKNYVFNTTFPNNIEYIAQLSKGSNLNENEKLLIKLFKRLIKSFDHVCENNLIFDEKDFIEKILKINKYNNGEKVIKSYLNKEKKEEESDYTVLNLDEYKKNLEELGLPFFEY